MKNILPSLALALIAGLTGSQAADNVTTSNTTSTSTTSSSGLGYGNITSTLPSNSTFSFGSRYAILNLDLINGIVGSFNTTPAGQAFINSTSQWIDAVQSKSNSSSGSYDPLTIYTRIYFSTLQRPELGLGVPFSNIAQGFGNITESSETGELYPAFAEKVLDTDVVLQKTRFYAGEPPCSLFRFCSWDTMSPTPSGRQVGLRCKPVEIELIILLL
jgi:hypothetical protein